MAEVGEVIKLKTCPFCGGKPLLQQNGVTTKYWEVVCIECDLIGMAHSTNIEASAWWNRRAPDPERDELREALRPFAEIGRQIGNVGPERTFTIIGLSVEADGINSHYQGSLKGGDFRAARLLAGKG